MARPRRRNPDLLGDALVVGAIGVAGYVAYRHLFGGSQPAAGSPIGSAQSVWDVLNQPLGPTIAKVTQGSDVLCSDIAYWRAKIQPGILGTGLLGYANDWSGFRAWESQRLYGDPGNTPPGCW